MSVPSFNITYLETDDGTEVVVDDLNGFYNALLDFVVRGFYTKFETTLFCKFEDKDGNKYDSEIDEHNLDRTLETCLDYFERGEQYEKCITIKKMINERL